MEDVLNIPQTDNTPSFIYDPDKQTLTLRGHSIPENAMRTYAPAIKWAEKFIQQHQKLICEIQIDYFNSSSFKQLIELLKILSAIENLTINFYYEEDDEDMIDVAHDIELKLNLPLNVIAVDEDEI